MLFFGVAVLAGLGGRADHQRTAALLRRRGAQRSVIVVFRVFEALLPVLGGVDRRGRGRRGARADGSAAGPGWVAAASSHRSIDGAVVDAGPRGRRASCGC